MRDLSELQTLSGGKCLPFSWKCSFRAQIEADYKPEVGVFEGIDNFYLL